jgi:hypothetical protein
MSGVSLKLKDGVSRAVELVLGEVEQLIEIYVCVCVFPLCTKESIMLFYMYAYLRIYISILSIRSFGENHDNVAAIVDSNKQTGSGKSVSVLAESLSLGISSCIGGKARLGHARGNR